MNRCGRAGLAMSGRSRSSSARRPPPGLPDAGRRLRRSRGRSSRWLRPGKNRSTGTATVAPPGTGILPSSSSAGQTLSTTSGRSGAMVSPTTSMPGSGSISGRKSTTSITSSGSWRTSATMWLSTALCGRRTSESPTPGSLPSQTPAPAPPRSGSGCGGLLPGRTNPTSRQPPPSLNPGRGSPAGSDRQNSSTGSSLNQGSTRSMAECLKGSRLSRTSRNSSVSSGISRRVGVALGRSSGNSNSASMVKNGRGRHSPTLRRQIRSRS